MVVHSLVGSIVVLDSLSRIGVVDSVLHSSFWISFVKTFWLTMRKNVCIMVFR